MNIIRESYFFREINFMKKIFRILKLISRKKARVEQWIFFKFSHANNNNKIINDRIQMLFSIRNKNAISFLALFFLSQSQIEFSFLRLFHFSKKNFFSVGGSVWQESYNI